LPVRWPGLASNALRIPGRIAAAGNPVARFGNGRQRIADRFFEVLPFFSAKDEDFVLRRVQLVDQQLEALVPIALEPTAEPGFLVEIGRVRLILLILRGAGRGSMNRLEAIRVRNTNRNVDYSFCLGGSGRLRSVPSTRFRNESHKFSGACSMRDTSALLTVRELHPLVETRKEAFLAAVGYDPTTVRRHGAFTWLTRVQQDNADGTNKTSYIA